MPKPTSVPINGSVLRWAIRESGILEETVAENLQVPIDMLRQWEQGSSFPSKTQFGKLTVLLKRPSALFFLPEPPDIEPTYAHFRWAPQAEESRLASEEARGIRSVTRLQGVVSLLLKELNQEPPAIPQVSETMSAEAVAADQRRTFGLTVETQLNWPSASHAFREWRQLLERKGVFVLHLRLGRTSCRGFSIWDDRAPIIAVNTAYNFPARIYTIFHEYAHLLTRTNAVCTSFTGPIARSNDLTERWCERFAASFLLPRKEFLENASQLRRGAQVVTDFAAVARLANQFKVSLRAVALRLVELDRADLDLYLEVDNRARVTEQEKHGGGGKGQKRYERRLDEYGRRLPKVFLEGVRRDIIDSHDVLDYLDLSTKSLDDLERALAS